MCHQPVTFEGMSSVEALSVARRMVAKDIPADNTIAHRKLAELDLNALSQSLRDGTYRHRQCNARWRYPEGKRRFIDSPTLLDKVVQRAYVNTITPVVEAISSNCSHGFRPERSIHTGLWSLICSIQEHSFTHLFRTDIEGFFENILHEHMAAAIERNIRDTELTRFSLQLLSVAQSYKGINKGLPTGWLVNPLWANLLLTPIDAQLESAGLEFMRYADDYGIPQRSHNETTANRALLESGLRDLGLCLKDEASEKTYTRRLEGGVVVLGHEIKMTRGQLTCIVSKKSLKDIEQMLFGKVRKLHNCRQPRQIADEIIQQANGWSGNAVCYPPDWNHSRLRELNSVNAKLAKMIDALPPERHDLRALLKKKPLLTIRPLADMRLIKAPAA
jgi:hypothetical protein